MPLAVCGELKRDNSVSRRWPFSQDIGVRVPGWIGIGLNIAALIAGAIFLWVGLALATAIVILAGMASLPWWLRRLWARTRAPRTPVTIEGHCTKS